MLRHISLAYLFIFFWVFTACDSNRDLAAKDAKNPTESQVIAATSDNSGNTLTSGDNSNNDIVHLVTAAKKGDKEAVGKFIELGIDLNSTVNEERTALMEAAWTGNTDIVKLLIDSGVALNKSSTTAKGNALYGASWAGHTDVVKALVDGGVDVNTISQAQNTALWGAAFQGNTEIVKILLEAGANVDRKAIHDTALSAACRSNSIDIVNLLLEKGADPNLPDKYGASALHYAGDAAVVKALLGAGARVNMADAKGKTPLSNAKENGLDEVVRLIETAAIVSSNTVETLEKASRTNFHQR